MVLSHFHAIFRPFPISKYHEFLIFIGCVHICFKKVNKSQLPVQYFSQEKSWMTGDILDHILALGANGRSVLLLMYNAGCHLGELQHKYSKIEIMFLAPNTKSILCFFPTKYDTNSSAIEFWNHQKFHTVV